MQPCTAQWYEEYDRDILYDISRVYICTKDQLKINTNYGSSITANVGVFPGLPFVVIAFKRTCDKVSNADHAPNCYIITWLFSIVVVVVASVIIITVAINWKIITSTKSAAHNISLTIERDTIPCLSVPVRRWSMHYKWLAMVSTHINQLINICDKQRGM